MTEIKSSEVWWDPPNQWLISHRSPRLDDHGFDAKTDHDSDSDESFSAVFDAPKSRANGKKPPRSKKAPKPPRRPPPPSHDARVADNHESKDYRYFAVAWNFHVRDKKRQERTGPKRPHDSYCSCGGDWSRCADNPKVYE